MQVRPSRSRRIVTAPLVLLLASPLSIQARAADADVPFAATVASVCTVALGTPGTMAPGNGNTELDSANGTSGTAVVTATGGNFELSAIAPGDFTVAPPEYTQSTTFTATYAASGATTLPAGPGGTARPISPGITTATVDLKAVTASGVFSAGAYTAVVTVRCEATGS